MHARQNKFLRTLAIAAVLILAAGRSGDASGARLSPMQADNLFASLSRQKIVNLCGDGKRSAPTAKHPDEFLEYPFGAFFFENHGSVLMGASLIISGKVESGWENTLRQSSDTDKDDQLSHKNAVLTAEMHAKLDGISVHEYEGLQALKIMDNTPCLSSLSVR
jgi:hypothetical protein